MICIQKKLLLNFFFFILSYSDKNPLNKGTTNEKELLSSFIFAAFLLPPSG
jgi:hypothetical protein